MLLENEAITSTHSCYNHLKVDSLKGVNNSLHFIASSRSSNEVVDLKYVMWSARLKRALFDSKCEILNLYGGWASMIFWNRHWLGVLLDSSSPISYFFTCLIGLLLMLNLLSSSLLWWQAKFLIDLEKSSFSLTHKFSFFYFLHDCMY